MKRIYRIYIAGPYTQGDVAFNVGTAIAAANVLISYGFAPYVPHLSHFLHMAKSQPYQTWMAIGRVWLNQCDAVLRLPGQSGGADTEVAIAVSKDIPIFSSVTALLEALK